MTTKSRSVMKQLFTHYFRKRRRTNGFAVTKDDRCVRRNVINVRLKSVELSIAK